MIYLLEGIEGSTNLKKIYSDLNKEFFGGQLPNIKVKWNGKLKNAVGRAHVQYKGQRKQISKFLSKYTDEIVVSNDIEIDMNSLKIDISKQYDFNLSDLKAVMLHEQVHIFLYTQKKLGNHHDSSEFQNWIKKLRDMSGLNIPMRESTFKASPKLKAKEGYVFLVFGKGKIGFSVYSINFLKKNWLAFPQTLSRIIKRSSQIDRIEMYKVTHQIISTTTAKRSGKKISWQWTEEEIGKEIQRIGKKFGEIDKTQGYIKPQVLGMKVKYKGGSKEIRIDGNKILNWGDVEDI